MSEAPTTFSYAVPSLPGDVWITVESGSGVPAKYVSFHTMAIPFGPNGPFEARARFNLTAYVQDMIQEALASLPSPPSVGKVRRDAN